MEKPNQCPSQACLLTLLFFLIVALAFQWRQQAWTSEFGGHPDEAAHYVTGLFVRDAMVAGAGQVAHGFPKSPVKFAKDFAADYYDHYPKIGLGVWPPFFYVLQAGWTLLFGVDRMVILALMAVLAALLAAKFSRLARELEMSPATCVLGGALLLALPMVQQYSAMVMAEILSALLMLGAMERWGRFLDVGRGRDAVWFGLLGGFAVLTKGTGLALVLAAPLSLLAARKFWLLKRRALWAGVILFGLLAGPWTLATRKLGKGGWLYPGPCMAFTKEAVPYYAMEILVALGFIIALCAGIGVVRLLWLRKPEHTGLWMALISLVVAVPVFQCIAPVGLEARHLLPTLAPLLLLAFQGVEGISTILPNRVIAPVGLLAVFFLSPLVQSPGPSHFASIGNTPALSPFKITPKDVGGFRPVVQWLFDQPDKDARFLVSSDAIGEGMFISEVAQMDTNRPARVAHRASKILSKSEWRGGNYQPFYQSTDQVLTALKQAGYRYIVIDDSMPPEKRLPHHELLKQTIASDPARFVECFSSPVHRGDLSSAPPLRVYRLESL